MIVTDISDIPKTVDRKLVVPQPPAYTTCIQHASEGHTPATRLTATQAKAKCAQLHQALQEQALEMLISTSQLTGEAAELDITATDNEAQQRLNKLKSEEFPNNNAFERYLHITHQSLADQIYRVKTLLLTNKLVTSFAGGDTNHLPTPSQQQYAAELLKKWIAATNCRNGYQVPQCRQYTTPPTKPPAPDTLLHELNL